MEDTVLADLKAKSLALRKQHDNLGMFLSTVLSDAHSLAKAETKDGITPPVSDTHAVRAIRTAIKQIDDVLVFVKDDNEGANALRVKKDLLEFLLPNQPTFDDIKRSALEFIKLQSFSNARQAIGPTMKHLVDKFGASLDKGVALKAIQAVFAS